MGVYLANSYFSISTGKCFVDIADEMKEVYAVYCRNHDDAISLMEKVKLYINRTSSPHKAGFHLQRTFSLSCKSASDLVKMQNQRQKPSHKLKKI